MRVVILGLLAAVCAGTAPPDRVTEGLESQAQLAAAIMGPGGSFRVDESKSSKPVIALTIHRYFATDAKLERLKGLPDLEELILDGRVSPGGNRRAWRVTDVGVAHLKALKHLRTLTIPSSKITDAGLQHLGEMTQLQSLVIGHGTQIAATPNNVFMDSAVPNITDAGLQHLKGLHDLRSLALYGTRISNEGMKQLERFTELRRLELLFLDGGVTEGCLVHVGRLPKLESLDISDFHYPAKPFDSSLAELKSLSHLESLAIFSMRVTDDGLSHLGAIRHLKSLSLVHRFATMPVTDVGLERLKGLGELRSLTLAIQGLSDRGLRALSQLKGLETLVIEPLTFASITDDGLLQLRTLTKLKELGILSFSSNDRCKVTAKAIEALKKDLPGLAVR